MSEQLEPKRRKSPKVDALVRALEGAPLCGMTCGEVIAQTGMEENRATMLLQYAVLTARAFRLKMQRSQGGSRYFPTAQAMLEGIQAARDDVERRMRETAGQRLDDEQRRKTGLAERKQKADKVAVDAKRDRLIVRAKENVQVRRPHPVEVGVHIPAARAPREVQVIYPDNVKRTVRVAPPGRYEVTEPVRGGFHDEWLRLRGHA